MRGKWIVGIGVLFVSFVLVFGTGWAAEKKPIKLGVVFIMSGKDPEVLALPRLAVPFNRRNYGRLRLLIDELNRA